MSPLLGNEAKVLYPRSSKPALEKQPLEMRRLFSAYTAARYDFR